MAAAHAYLGVVSTVTVAAALGWSIAQGISSRHAAEREDARRVVEVGSPEEQVAVLRQLLQSRTEEAQTRGEEPRKRAIITARAGAESGSSRGVERTFSIRNVGDAPAIDLEVWLALDFSGEPASVASSSTSSVGSLVRSAVRARLAPSVVFITSMRLLRPPFCCPVAREQTTSTETIFLRATRAEVAAHSPRGRLGATVDHVVGGAPRPGNR